MLTRTMALTAIIGVAVQLGLAILGSGGFAAFFAEPAFATLAGVTVLSTAVALFTGANLSSGAREDRSNRWVFAWFAVISVLITYLPALTDRLNIWTFGGRSVRWLGIVVFTLGCTVRLWPVFVLGHRFSGLVAIQSRHELVTSGPYAHVRHPSYLGLLIAELGWALVFRSIIGVLLTLLTVPVIVGRMNAEEKLLRANFGADYEAYMRRTNRLLPGLY